MYRMWFFQLKETLLKCFIPPDSWVRITAIQFFFLYVIIGPLTLKLVILNRGPPLWSIGQSFWLQIRRPGFDSWHYHKKVVGLERGPLSLVSTTEELLDRKSSGFCLENREYGRRDPSRWPRDTFYQQKLAITSPTSGVRSRTQTMEVFFYYRFTRKLSTFTVALIFFSQYWGQGKNFYASPHLTPPLVSPSI
jgi:hypothetical protein